MQRRLISIITAVRNGKEHIQQTIQSVASQDFRDFEHLIIDGGSTDGTLGIIQQHLNGIAYHVSEPDKGISDAFNKGVLAARGSVILFLGSDDYLHDNSVLNRVATAMKSLKKPYFFYGNLEYIYKNKVKTIRRNYNYRKFCRYDCLPHQAMFLDRFFFDRYGPFDLNYKYAMDYEHTARFISDYEPEYIDVMISGMRRHGVSSRPIEAHDEMDRVRIKYGLASRFDVAVSRVVLYGKLAIARLLNLNW